MKVLLAFCDLARCPVSFDFGVWLVRAMAERDARGCDSMHVVMVPKEDGLGGFARQWGEHDEAATCWRFWRIVMAMIPLAGPRTTVTFAAHPRQAEGMICDPYWWPEGRAHLAGPLVDAARKRGKIPRFHATEAARRYVASWFGDISSPLVTLTVRNQSTHPDRNSNQFAWMAMRDWLMGKGFTVHPIIDSNVALGKARGGYAELDPDLRLALYERAAMNLIGNNGPATLLWFSDAPFLQFGFGLPAEQWTKHMAEHVHLKPGEQLPWTRADQRLIWRPDSFDVMREEFERWEQRKLA